MKGLGAGAGEVSWFQPVPGCFYCPGPGLTESVITSTRKVGEETLGDFPALSGPEFNLTGTQAAARVRP